MRAGRVRIGDVLELRRRPIAIDPLAEYVSIGVRSFGKGIFHYEPKPGAELSKLRFFEVRPDELVISNIKAWEGAIAVSGNDDQGCVASNRFLTYVPRYGAVDVSYLRYFFLSDAGLPLIQRASPGSADRNRTLAIDRFEALEIPLPGIEEQRRTASQLDAAAEKIARLKELSEKEEALVTAIPAAAARRFDLPEAGRQRLGWRQIPLREVLSQAKDEIPVSPDASYPNVGVLSFARGLFEKPPIEGARTSAAKLCRIRAGQFIYSRLFAFEGAYAGVDDRFDGYFVSNEFPTFDLDQEQVTLGFLTAYFSASTTWEELARESSGLGVRRQRVKPDKLLSHKLWLPPFEEQQRIATLVDRTRATGARSRERKRVTDALVPSLLNRAFA